MNDDLNALDNVCHLPGTIDLPGLMCNFCDERYLKEEVEAQKFYMHGKCLDNFNMCFNCYKKMRKILKENR